MNTNVGGIDKILRIVVGLSLVAWGVVTQNYWGAVGLVPLATALSGWCPAYLPFGISSAKKADS